MPPSAPPPDLRVLCRKLTSIPPAQLPHALPALTRHVIRCKDALSAPHEQKPKDDASAQGTAGLVNKLKTSISTLLNGRSREARFAAIGLVKAVVDVGGWEMLRASEPWVRGLLSIIQVFHTRAASCRDCICILITPFPEGRLLCGQRARRHHPHPHLRPRPSLSNPRQGDCDAHHPGLCHCVPPAHQASRLRLGFNGAPVLCPDRL